MLAKELISATITPLIISDTVNQAMNLMDEFKTSQMPVIKTFDSGNKLLLGIISEDDILNLPDIYVTIEEVRNILRTHSIYENQHIYDAIYLMGKNKLSIIPVVNNKNEYIGTINPRSIIKFLNKFTDINEAGGIIVMEMNNNDYSMAHIAQIIESQGSKIYNSYISQSKELGIIEVTLKINNDNIDGVLSALEHDNYKIKYTFINKNESFSKIEDNYESLMNYLDI